MKRFTLTIASLVLSCATSSISSMVIAAADVQRQMQASLYYSKGKTVTFNGLGTCTLKSGYEDAGEFWSSN